MRTMRTQDVVFSDYARSLISFKARQLTRHPGFSRSDQDDLEQEFWATLLTRLDRFDPDRASLNTFTDRVVNSTAATILRDRRRQKRAAGFHTRSLDVLLANDPESTAIAVSETDHLRRNGRVPDDETTRRENREAVHHALDSMPSELREVCRHVMGGSISSAARDLGTSRRQIRNALDKARPWLVQAGFSESGQDFGHHRADRHK